MVDAASGLSNLGCELSAGRTKILVGIVGRNGSVGDFVLVHEALEVIEVREVVGGDLISQYAPDWATLD
jgi:hypothetical protein